MLTQLVHRSLIHLNKGTTFKMATKLLKLAIYGVDGLTSVKMKLGNFYIVREPLAVEPIHSNQVKARSADVIGN